MSEARQLYRSEDDRVVAGVCGGLAKYLGVDPTIVRVLYVVLTVLTGGGGGVAVYLALWLLVPPQSRLGVGAGETAKTGAEELRQQVERGADGVRGAYRRWRTRDDQGIPAQPPPPPVDLGRIGAGRDEGGPVGAETFNADTAGPGLRADLEDERDAGSPPADVTPSPERRDDDPAAL